MTETPSGLEVNRAPVDLISQLGPDLYATTQDGPNAQLVIAPTFSASRVDIPEPYANIIVVNSPEFTKDPALPTVYPRVIWVPEKLDTLVHRELSQAGYKLSGEAFHMQQNIQDISPELLRKDYSVYKVNEQAQLRAVVDLQTQVYEFDTSYRKTSGEKTLKDPTVSIYSIDNPDGNPVASLTVVTRQIQGQTVVGIWNVVVDTSQQGKRLGTKILSHALLEVKNVHLDAIVHLVSTHAGQKLYTNFGFKTDQVIHEYQPANQLSQS